MKTNITESSYHLVIKFDEGKDELRCKSCVLDNLYFFRKISEKIATFDKNRLFIIETCNYSFMTKRVFCILYNYLENNDQVQNLTLQDQANYLLLINYIAERIEIEHLLKAIKITKDLYGKLVEYSQIQWDFLSYQEFYIYDIVSYIYNKKISLTDMHSNICDFYKYCNFYKIPCGKIGEVIGLDCLRQYFCLDIKNRLRYSFEKIIYSAKTDCLYTIYFFNHIDCYVLLDQFHLSSNKYMRQQKYFLQWRLNTIKNNWTPKFWLMKPNGYLYIKFDFLNTVEWKQNQQLCRLSTEELINLEKYQQSNSLEFKCNQNNTFYLINAW